VLGLMVLRSELGGRATLQKALALDSLGQNKDAELLYRTIRNHPTGAVAKKAQQLHFGFEAQNFLRTDRLNFGVKKDDYMQYFRQFADRNKLWVAGVAGVAGGACSRWLLAGSGCAGGARRHSDGSGPLPPWLSLWQLRAACRCCTAPSRRRCRRRWVASEADRLADEQMGRVSAAIAVAVLGTPLALAVVLAASARH
jgi:hypothetical protein